MLEALEIVFCMNSDAAEGLADRNGHRRKDVGEGKRVSWEVARTKGEGRECKLTKKMLLHSDLLQFCLQKNGRFLSSSLTQRFLIIEKLTLRTN